MLNYKLNALDIISSGILGKYDGTLMLTPSDLQEILGCGESSAYEYLKNEPPFRVEKIGGKVCIFAVDFWAWYLDLGEVA